MNLRVAILDDYFPNSTTGFRLAEFDGLLRRFPEAVVFTTARLLEDLSDLGPDWNSRMHRIRKFKKWKLALGKFDVAYVDFYNNAVRFVPVLDKFRIPYVLTLYPGGGFSLTEPDVQAFIQQIALSKTPKTIITTSRAAKIYIEKLQLSESTNLLHITGVPIQKYFFETSEFLRQDYPESSTRVFKFVFLAHKYTMDGLDKGWPQFQNLILMLDSLGFRIEATVIGPWTTSDLSDTSHGNLFRFLGTRPDFQLPKLLCNQHFIVSISTPNLVVPGQFDGFPVSSVVEAALCGVIPILNDPLNMNEFLVGGDNSVFLSDSKFDTLLREVEFILRTPSNIKLLAHQAQTDFFAKYNEKMQLFPRYEALELLAKGD